MAKPSPALLAAALCLATVLGAIPLVFREPATTVASIRWLATSCEGLARSGLPLTSPAIQIDSLAATAGARALPGPEWSGAGRAGSWEIFPMRLITVLFPSDSSVLAVVSCDEGIDPRPEPAIDRFVDVRRLGPQSIALVVSRADGGSQASDAARLLVEGR